MYVGGGGGAICRFFLADAKTESDLKIADFSSPAMNPDLDSYSL